MAELIDDSQDDELEMLSLPSPTDSLLEALADLDSSAGLTDSSNPPMASSNTNDSPYVSGDLQIIAQPCYTSKLRTRSDYEKENRRSTLKAKELNSAFTSPTIRIAPAYINTAESYYIGIFLVTVLHQGTQCRYFHPYELEDLAAAIRNPVDNSFWYPVVTTATTDIQSFPNLRIAKRTERELGNDGSLRVFHGHDSNLLNPIVPERLSARKMVQEYRLKNIQLAFAIGRKQNPMDSFPVILDPHRVVFSEEMEENEVTESTRESNVVLPDLKVSKYAPHYGDPEGNEDMLLLFSGKVGKLKRKDLHITFECCQLTELWRSSVDTTIEVTGQLVSYKTPPFPYSAHQSVNVTIRVQYEERMCEPLQYEYRPKFQCATCQGSTIMSTLPISRQYSNKRPHSWFDDVETDAVVPVGEHEAALQRSSSEHEPPSSHPQSPSTVNTQPTDSDDAKYDKEIEQSVAAIFTDNDYKPFLRICRAFISRRPDLLHQAIANGHSELLSQFIVGTRIGLFQPKDELGESVLLHAIRLNRLAVVSALLEKKNADTLIDDVNNQRQNVMHVVALNRECEAMLDQLVSFCSNRSINIGEKFDCVDGEGHTPLQLSIVKNNLPAVRVLLKYCDKNVRKTSDDTRDNLVHLVVRHGDLAMLEYVLGVEELKKQGSEANAKMTPTQLAQWLKRDDMVEYLNKIYCRRDTSEPGDASHE